MLEKRTAGEGFHIDRQFLWQVSGLERVRLVAGAGRHAFEGVLSASPSPAERVLPASHMTFGLLRLYALPDIYPCCAMRFCGKVS